MWLALALLGIALTAQIPPPDIGPDSTPDLKSRRREIFERENASLKALADRLDKEQKWDASRAVRNRIVRPTNSDALTRFMPLPEIVPAHGAGPSVGSEPWKSDLEKIRKLAATEFLGLAKQAATASPPHWGLASLCVRDAIDHDPDQGEARRLLGFEPHEEGWARPFAIRQLRAGYVLHPTYGWVPSSWVPKLESGQLPSPSTPRSPKVRWLPAAEADRLREDGNPPWKISTEHFEIRSNVPLSKTIAFGRRLEAFYELFYTVMADVIGNRLPMANRIKNPSLRTEPPYRPHQIYYFATKDQYLAHLRSIAPPGIDQSLGYYDPLGPGSKTRKPAYFFLDEGGQINAIATLYHEVSHQLLFESVGGASSYERNEGNYWVFEGLGTFFETVVTHPDGSMEVGGFVGPRIEAAVDQFAQKQSAVPTGLFVGLRKEIFELKGQIYANYQQAMALTLFLMRRQDGTYRSAFLEYVRDALKGNLRPGLAPPLRDRLGVTYETIDAQFLDFLKSRDARKQEPRRKDQAAADPAAPGNQDAITRRRTGATP